MTANSPIVAIAVEPRSYPIVVPFSIALESLATADIVLVRCTDADGNVGIGEAAPFPKLTYDTVEIARRELDQRTSAFIGLTTTAAFACLNSGATDWRRTSITAFCGIESALYDLRAKQQGISLARLHGIANVARIETDITLPIMPCANVGGFFEIFAGHGFRTVKIKVSGQVSSDLDLIMEVRKFVPHGTRITLDGNQGFSFGGARALISALIDNGVRPIFFEQPLPEKNLVESLALAQAQPLPICLDESVRTLMDLKNILNESPLVKNLMINLKIMKSGITETAAILDLASRHQVPVMIGGMLESEIAMGHSLHLACGKGGVSYFDLDTPFFFRSSPVRGGPWRQKTCILECPSGPGLGIDLI